MKILVIKTLALLAFFPAIATLVSASSVYGPYSIGQSTNIAGVSIYNVTSNSAWLRESGGVYGPYGTGQATNLAGVSIYNISSSSNSVLLLESPPTTISTSTTSISTSTSTSIQTTSARTTTINTTSIPTTTVASSTVTTTVTTTAASNQSAPSGAIYIGQAITNSSLTLLFTGVSAPNSNGVSNASFDLYRNGALIEAISAAPQSSASIKISGGTAYIYLYRLYTNYYSSKDWAQVYLGYTQQPNSSSTTSTTSTPIQSTSTIVSPSRGFSTVYFRNYLNFGKFSAQVGYPGAGETEAVILYENGNLIDQRLAYPNSSYTVSAGNATITLRTGIINVSGIENYNWMQLNMSVSYGGQSASTAPTTTIYGSNTTTSIIRTTAIGNSSVKSAPSGAIYVGQAITNSSLTLLFTGVSSPNSNGVSNASFDLYSQDVLVKAISLAPQSYASVQAHSGTAYVYLHLLGVNADPSKDWAQVYLGYSPQANNSAAASISTSVEATTAESSTSIRTTTVYVQSNFTNSVSSAVNAITNSVESVFNHNATKISATTTTPATPPSNSTSGSPSPSQSTGTGIAQIFNSLVKFFGSI